jgi:hypothetical protein
MTRDIGVKRLYTMGQYQNVTFEETIKDLPMDLSKEDLDNYRYLMLLDLELQYRSYLKMYQQVSNVSIDEAVNALEKSKLETIKELGQNVK